MRITRIEDRCDNCMRCVRDCVASVWRDVEGVPTPAAPEFCILCGHCLAVCPQLAIIHDGLDAGQLREANRELLDEETYRETVMTRRSVRHYKTRPLERERIERIIDLARYSPSASNAQNVGYIIVTDRDLLRKISGRVYNGMARFRKILDRGIGKIIRKIMSKSRRMQAVVRYMDAFDYYKEQTAGGRDYILYNAPALLLLHGPIDGDNPRDNCVIAATNIVNYAHSMGLGTCYVGFVTTVLRFDRTLRKLVSLPKGNRVFASIVMGYPAISYTFTVPRKQPKITWLDKESSG